MSWCLIGFWKSQSLPLPTLLFICSSPSCFCASSCSHCFHSSCILHTLALSLLCLNSLLPCLHSSSQILSTARWSNSSVINLRCTVIQFYSFHYRYWRAGTAVKSTHCFCRGAEFCSQHPHQGAHYQVQGLLRASEGTWSHRYISIHRHMQICFFCFVFMFHDLTYTTLFKDSSILGKFGLPLLVS